LGSRPIAGRARRADGLGGTADRIEPDRHRARCYAEGRAVTPRHPRRPGCPPSAPPFPDEIPDDAVLPNRAYPSQRDQRAPVYQPPQRTAPVYQPSQRSAPALGAARTAEMVAASPATLTPAATLACPLVSALDHWMSDGVQPAAMRWFGSQVVEIK